ncbi:MAG: ABC transporter substrate-binding protein, partial [Pseudomonadota bacterium]
MPHTSRGLLQYAGRALGVLIAAFALAAAAGPAAAQQKKPIKIGFSMALTGGLAGGGKAALIAMEIWRDDVNKKGGLLGRPVELVYYDDATQPANVPGIYTKLIDVDKVDLVVSGYGTNLIVPAMPIIMRKKLVFPALFGLGANEELKYDRYFQIMPAGPEPKTDWSKGFFQLAMDQKPRPKTVAIVAADAEFALNAAAGARENAKKLGFQIVYDKTYPPTTTDFTPIVRAIQATNPEIVYVGSYPPDSVGMVKAANEIGLKTKLFGGGMVGLQFAAIQQNLGPML